jgi:hypothetical protein
VAVRGRQATANRKSPHRWMAWALLFNDMALC